MIIRLLLVYILFIFLKVIDCQQCWKAEESSDRLMCKQMARWDQGSRLYFPYKTRTFRPNFRITSPLEAFPQPASALECFTITCVCQFFGGSIVSTGCRMPDGTVFGKAIRKEYRLLSDDERKRFHNAFNAIKDNGQYDELSKLHATFTLSPGAHGGPAFLAWHREFVKRMELALRQVDSSVAIPYWDSVLDGSIPNTEDSIIFSEDFMGDVDTNDLVSTGPFKDWIGNQGHRIQRQLGLLGRMFTEADLLSVAQQTNFMKVMAYSVPKEGCPQAIDFKVFEYIHGNMHNYVNGDMLIQATSANDPMFFIHHSFVDYVWEDWRQNRQNRMQRESQYPPDNINCSSSSHFGDQTMSPFGPMTNRNGLSNQYTDNLYSYAPRPTCSATTDCGSNYLFCDRSHGTPRCAIKIKLGGNCIGYSNGEPMCYNGECKQGMCIAVVQPVVNETCLNMHVCCGPWMLRGECTKNGIWMNRNCAASCAQCTPRYNLNEDCSDRASDCSTRVPLNGCFSLFMQENCRKSCLFCETPRVQLCNSNMAVTTTTSTTTVASTTTMITTTTATTTIAPSVLAICMDNDPYCRGWARDGQCRSNPVWMLRNCRVSCGTCGQRRSLIPGPINKKRLPAVKLSNSKQQKGTKGRSQRINPLQFKNGKTTKITAKKSRQRVGKDAPAPPNLNM